MKQKRSYMQSIHTAGRIWMLTAFALLILVPTIICIHYKSWPGFGPVFQGLLGVAPIFWTVGTIEVFTYTPMLGAGGSYLGFVTGNLTNLKAALRAQRHAVCRRAVSPVQRGGRGLIHHRHCGVQLYCHHRNHHPGCIYAINTLRPMLESPDAGAGVCQHSARAVWRPGGGVCIQGLENSPGAAALHGGAVSLRTQPGRFCRCAGAGGFFIGHRRGAHPV